MGDEEGNELNKDEVWELQSRAESLLVTDCWDEEEEDEEDDKEEVWELPSEVKPISVSNFLFFCVIKSSIVLGFGFIFLSSIFGRFASEVRRLLRLSSSATDFSPLPAPPLDSDS